MEWNAVVTVKDEGYAKARKLLQRFGEVGTTGYFNLLMLRVADARRLLEGLREEGEREEGILAPLAGVVPVLQTFSFNSPQEFEEKARVAVCAFLPALQGKSFHLRMHRRGFKGKLSSIVEEQFLDRYLLEALELAGSRGRITFDDPDFIIALETIGGRGGMSLWSREELRRYPLLHLD